MENITYDKHGNMKTMQLYGKSQSAAYGALVDNLTMTYTGNQLTRVEDAAAAVTIAGSMDFKNYSNTTAEYTYNANGAMNKDLNKGISGIQYNSLNLPRMMDIKSPVAEARNEYTYSASGSKLKVIQKWNPDYNTAPVIGSAINTAALTMTKTTDYVGNIIYENNALKRILVDGGYIEGNTYHFYLTDHLGNNRVVANQGGTIIQKTHYYPFGSNFATSPGAELQPYKYNGKELDQMHGLNLYDYSARLYDPVIPHFGTVDPLAEKYYSWSPYAYVGNNPIRFIDPDGREPEEKPIKLFRKGDTKAHWSADNFRYKTGDNQFYVFAHASSTSFEYNLNNEKDEKVTVYTAEEINAILSERSPEWKKAMENNEDMTVTFYACNMASEDMTENNLAKNLSVKYPNLTVKAPNGYSKSFIAWEVGIEARAEGENGAFIIYRNGEKIGREEFKYPSLLNFIESILGNDQKKNDNDNQK